jgi:ADP-ribose pyrophosphatase
VVGGVARRRQEVGLEADVEPHVDLAEPVDELVLDGCRDHDGDHVGKILPMPLYEGPLFDVERRDGKDVVVHGPAVAVLAVDRADTVTLVRQQRVPAGGKLLELPAGGVEPGESPLETAQRELREETGLHGGEWVEVATFFTTPGFCDEKMHLFLATGVEAGEAAPEGSEDIELVRVPVADIPSLVDEIEDAKTLVGLLLLLRRR